MIDLRYRLLCPLGYHTGYIQTEDDSVWFHCSRCGRDVSPTEIPQIDRVYGEGGRLIDGGDDE